MSKTLLKLLSIPAYLLMGVWFLIILPCYYLGCGLKYAFNGESELDTPKQVWGWYYDTKET